jgi:alkylation response protein AidB-like acyl-CoA dehydrogenase
MVKRAYQRIQGERKPLVLRGWFEQGTTQRAFFHETLGLPCDDATVDHIRAFSEEDACVVFPPNALISPRQELEAGMALDLETRARSSNGATLRARKMPEAKVSEEDRVPDSVIAEMRELGLFGLSIPQEYGGLGLTMEEEVLVCFELGQTSPRSAPSSAPMSASAARAW